MTLKEAVGAQTVRLAAWHGPNESYGVWHVLLSHRGTPPMCGAVIPEDASYMDIEQSIYLILSGSLDHLCHVCGERLSIAIGAS